MIPILDTSPRKIKGIGDKFQKILLRYGYNTVYDLLIHFPEYYIDVSGPDNLIEEGIEKVYEVSIGTANLYRNYRKKISVINVSGTIGEIPVNLAVFNKPYLMELFRTSEQLKIFGKIKSVGAAYRIENPRILKAEEGIIPIYRNIGRIPGGTVRNIIENIFAAMDLSADIIPEHLAERNGFRPFRESLTGIHTPDSIGPGIEKYRERFIYTEFLLFQLETHFIRNRSGKTKRTRNYTVKGIDSLLKHHVDFDLTPDQRISLDNIITDLTGGTAMQRLLLGDVGSGKTVISFLFLLIAANNNYQGAFLAPTEILVSQHYENALGFFKGIHIALLTGSTPASEREQIIADLRKGNIRILFGTHSIINDKICFKNLTAIVIDEQHRFGVSQRAALFYKSEQADLIVTTATPIPRTLLLSLYRDLDVSEIRSMPAGRVAIETLILKKEIREQFYTEIRRRVDAGEKAFIVVPLITESARFRELRSLEGELPFFRKVLKGTPFGMISGKADQEERVSEFRRFSRGEIRILLSTTVIEVGIDIRDATIMIIEDADKFGLSQLHQLRGRVGRGDKKSFCYLFPSANITESGRERLKIIRETSNGFEIAEKDLKMRGGGNITGTEQSGFLDFRVSDIREHPELFFRAGRDAAELITDETLQNAYIKAKLRKLDSVLKKISFS